MSGLFLLRRGVPLVNRGSSAVRALSTEPVVGDKLTPHGSLDAPESASNDSPPRPRRRKKRGPDTPYVVRRTAYMDEVSKIRKDFILETAQNREAALRAREEKQSASVADVQSRLEAKRAKSEAAFAAALKLREEQKAKREEKRDRGLKFWHARNEMLDERRLHQVDRLNADAENWVTEENLLTKVDDLMDSFFIDVEAAEHARGDTARPSNSESMAA